MLCAVRSCRKTAENDNVVLFNFPEDKERCKLWAVCCNQETLYESFQAAGKSLSRSNYKVCSLHFSDRMFKTKTELKPDARPILHLKKNSAEEDQYEMLKENLINREVQETEVKKEAVTVGIQTEEEKHSWGPRTRGMLEKLKLLKRKNALLKRKLEFEKKKNDTERFVQKGGVDVKGLLDKCFDKEISDFIWYHYEMLQKEYQNENMEI